MTVIEKAYELRRQLALSEDDISYATSVRWGEDKEAEKMKMYVLASNVIELFGTNRINDIDYDQREKIINDYDKILEEYLNKFPEYAERQSIKR